MRALLDVNVLIALVDSNYAFLERAHDWWGERAGGGWASCPLTESGVVRVMSSAAYSQSARFSPSEIIGRVQTFALHSDHAFSADDLSVRDTERFVASRLHSSRQVTGTYLLALAVARGGCLVTFDRGVATTAVVGARPHHLVVIG